MQPGGSHTSGEPSSIHSTTDITNANVMEKNSFKVENDVI